MFLCVRVASLLGLRAAEDAGDKVLRSLSGHAACIAASNHAGVRHAAGRSARNGADCVARRVEWRGPQPYATARCIMRYAIGRVLSAWNMALSL